MNESETKKGVVLVVDDKLENLEVLTEILTMYDYQVCQAQSGQLALTAAREQPPDLILLDIMMPGLNGYEVCQQLKAEEVTRDIPVIFLSALNETGNKVRAFEAGGLDYITKPFEIREVLARVETHVTLRNMRQRLQEQNFCLQQELNERKRAEDALQHRNRQLQLLNQVGQMFSASLELEHVLELILGEIQRLLDVYALSFWVIVPATRELLCMQAQGPGSAELLHWRLTPGQGITGWVAEHGESIVIPDTWADERHFKSVDKQTGLPIRSMLSLPLRVKGAVIGVLNLVDLRVGHFTSHDLILLEPIAAAAASAIENARLYTLAQQELAERKEAEAALLAAHNELQAKNAQLQELNASKDKFFSIISHDLRSPFTALLGFAQLLAENIDQYEHAQIKHQVGLLHASAERLYALLENLLTWARLQRGMMEHHPELIALAELVEDNVALFAARAEQKQVTLTAAIPASISAYADYSMVNTVLRNLVSNALKFTRAGDFIEISVQAGETSVAMAVADTGIGIRPEDFPKLFRLDAQYTNIGTAGEAGTGLGLLLCQELVERNHGKIRVTSAVGQGTTFTFTLPRQPPAGLTAAMASPPEELHHAS